MRASTWSGRFPAMSASACSALRADLVARPLAVERLYLVALMGAIVYAAFFVAR